MKNNGTRFLKIFNSDFVIKFKPQKLFYNTNLGPKNLAIDVWASSSSSKNKF